jgi:hypothetical protein
MTKLLKVSVIAAERLSAVGKGPRHFHSVKIMRIALLA